MNRQQVLNYLYKKVAMPVKDVIQSYFQPKFLDNAAKYVSDKSIADVSKEELKEFAAGLKYWHKEKTFVRPLGLFLQLFNTQHLVLTDEAGNQLPDQSPNQKNNEYFMRSDMFKFKGIKDTFEFIKPDTLYRVTYYNKEAHPLMNKLRLDRYAFIKEL